MNEKDRFRALANEMFPLIDKMSDVLKEHGVVELAGVTLSAEGYMVFSVHQTEWELKRLNKEDAPVISTYHSEEL